MTGYIAQIKYSIELIEWGSHVFSDLRVDHHGGNVV